MPGEDDKTLTTEGVFEGDGFIVPPTWLGKIQNSIQTGSVLARLSPERPTLYGDVSATRMTDKPRAQVLGEREQKVSSGAKWEGAKWSPVKFQTTVRVTKEVTWLDEDHKLSVVSDIIAAIGESMSRAVDLIGLHGINPITGTRAEQVLQFLNQTEQRTTASGIPDDDIEEAIGAGSFIETYVPNGIALDGRFGFNYATQKNSDGVRIHPEAGYGQQVGNIAGMNAVTSTAVSGRPEVAAGTGLSALMGDWSQVKWGFQRRIPVELIPYGDPDGNGDLKGHNEIAYRAEGVIYVAIFSLDAFLAIDSAAGGGAKSSTRKRAAA